MDGTDKTVEELREMVQDTRDELRLATYFHHVRTAADQLGSRLRMHPAEKAFVVAGLACTLADAAEDRGAVIEALHRCWPEMFGVVSEATIERVLAEARGADQ